MACCWVTEAEHKDIALRDAAMLITIWCEESHNPSVAYVQWPYKFPHFSMIRHRERGKKRSSS